MFGFATSLGRFWVFFSHIFGQDKKFDIVKYIFGINNQENDSFSFTVDQI